VEAVDALADDYAAILREKGIQYPVLPRAGTAEELVKIFGEAQFDLVYAENSLDHTQDPAEAFRSLVRVAKPGGIVAVKLMEREGSSERWLGLHKFDLWPEWDKLWCKSRFGEPLDLAAGLPLAHELTTLGFLYTTRRAFVSAWRKL
jgi:SAM-dependent methyltransferase